MNNEIDHEYTKLVVCPYCGYEDKDSWELGDEDRTVECGNCEKMFFLGVYVSVSYSTSKIEGQESK